MGFLTHIGQTLDYFESKAYIDYIKEHGIIQFLNLYKKFKDLQQMKTYWGDEIENHLINIDPVTKVPRLQPNSEYIFENCASDKFSLQPEFGAWMIETVPGLPYESNNGDPRIVLENMRLRRNSVKAVCKDGDTLFSGTSFPLLGVGDYFISRHKEKEKEKEKERDEYETSGSNDDLEEGKDSFSDETESCSTKSHNNFTNFSRSQFVHDDIVTSHPRFPTTVENVRLRRGCQVSMKMPIYRDVSTNMEATKEEPYPGFIYMDCLHFGMGHGCLQITFGTKNIEEARYLTDQMAVFSSLMLPLTAATPIFKGKLSDIDVRWDTITGSVDCRTPEEQDPTNPQYIPKSRYGSISYYISTRPQCKDTYNDIGFPVDHEIMDFTEETAKEMGMEIDKRLLQHLGFLFIRDPMVVFADKIYMDDHCNTNHFENFQSTNWNSVRFKPPPSFNSEVGWRVELRTPESQLTPEENTAYAMFSYFMAKVIVKKELNFYIPISKVDENFIRGHKRNAILTEKFWFRQDLKKDSEDKWIELTMDEILHGKQGEFVGLMNLVYDLIREEYGIDIVEEWKKVKKDAEYIPHKVVENMRFFEIISNRARGEMPTIATWIRNFVLKHPKYNQDSIISQEIASDLIIAMNSISDGAKKYEDFC